MTRTDWIAFIPSGVALAIIAALLIQEQRTKRRPLRVRSSLIDTVRFESLTVDWNDADLYCTARRVDPRGVVYACALAPHPATEDHRDGIVTWKDGMLR